MVLATRARYLCVSAGWLRRWACKACRAVGSSCWRPCISGPGDPRRLQGAHSVCQPPLHHSHLALRNARLHDVKNVCLTGIML